MRRAGIVKLARNVVGKYHNIQTSRDSVAQHKKLPDETFTTIETSRGKRIVRRLDHLYLPEIRNVNFQLVKEILNAAGIEYWVYERPWPNAHIFNLLDSDFDDALSVLANHSKLEHWYFREIAESGRPRGSEKILPNLKSYDQVGGFSLYEYVRPRVSDSFGAGPRQGVRFIKWTTDEATGEIVAGIWNPVSRRLPNPALNPADFEYAEEEFSQPLGHSVTFPIDVVLTWVNGDDPAWNSRKNQALGIEDPSDHVLDASDTARFESFDELRYCLRSIEQFAPWVRKIFIVTDRQRPTWLMESCRLKVIDHSEIWENADDLPVFNSHAIEANIHRIDGLSEHYLYMNDDFILGRPISPDLFFHPGGTSKVFYSKALVEFGPISDLDNVSTVAAKNARALLNSVDLPVMNRKFYHAPYALRKSVVEEICALFPDAIAATSTSKFRSTTDVALSGSLYFQYGLAKGYVVPGKIRYGYIDPAAPQGLNRLRRLASSRNLDTLVINDGSQATTVEQREQIRVAIPELLSSFLPVPSSFEASK